MIQWIMETFFQGDDSEEVMEHALQDILVLRRQLHAHQIAYSEEINWYKSELRRLQTEIGQIIHRQPSRFSSTDASGDSVEVSL
jgi:hypothetical protein